MMPTDTQPQSQQEQQPIQPQAEETHTQEDQQPTAERREEEGRGQETRARRKVLHLHTAHPRVPVPYVTPGDAFRNARAATSATTSLLPSPPKLAFHGLLGAMAVVEAVEWPIAIALGAATEVITREQAARQRAEHERGERERADREQARQATERTEPGRPVQAAMS
ncbi:hypothetical protein [Streptomyces sp. DSM 40750]|uniref:hypothetical protein n=1 Tax=Streptomyces sp. DSM 40750 TaxID=2801030 RepID=UPI00214B2AB4|nr:hypothetical protein [Streptomyces sp. DSM 40750]UUU21939.1 hypothetical protein JIX55_17300 [Streptomyces sp. DSM 40750]